MPHQCLKCGELFNEGSTTILRGCPECRGTRFFYTQAPLTETERKRLLSSSEITLREAIEQLAQQAKDGPLEASGEDGTTWTLTGPPATPVIADPALVPKDLPSPAPTLSLVLEQKKVVVKVPPRPKRSRRGKGEQPRWDYEAPAAPHEPEPTSPPLFSTVGLRQPPAPSEPATTPATPPAPTAAPTKTPVAPAPERLDVPPAFQPATDQVAPSPDGPPETIRIATPGHYEIDVKRLLEDNPIVIQRDGTYLIHLASLFEAGKGKRDG